MAVTVVGTSPAGNAFSTSISSPSSPAGLATGDVLLAIVLSGWGEVVTPPAGWSLVNEGIAARDDPPTEYSRTYIFSKNTVGSGDSSTAFTFTQPASTPMYLSYIALRSDSAGLTLGFNFVTNETLLTSAPYIVFDDLAAVGPNNIAICIAGLFGGGFRSSNTNGTGGTAFTVTDTGDLGDNGWSLFGSYQTISAPTTLTGAYYATEIYDLGTWSLSKFSLLYYDTPGPTTYEDEVTDYTFVDGYSDTTAFILGLVADIPTILAEPGGRQFLVLLLDTAIVLNADTVLGAVPDEQYIWALRAALGSVTGDTLTGADTAVPFPRWGYVQRDQIALTQTEAPTLRYRSLLAEGVDIIDGRAVAQPVLLTDTATATETLAVQPAVLILDALRVADTTLPVARYVQALTQSVSLGDALGRFLGAAVAETVSVTRTTTAVQRAMAALVQNLTLADTLGHALILKVTVAEDIDITPAQALQMLYRPALRDGVLFEVAYSSPSGTFTTWAMNTRTTAVTEYTDYEFNSFAQMGQRYIASADDGLYALDGATDDGRSIIANLKTGLAQFAGSRFSAIKGVYLGLRATGEFQVKIIDGAGVERTYKILVDARRTAKVQVGKGIRTRYLAFELVSTGQDFDLDTVEIVPILEQRRV